MSTVATQATGAAAGERGAFTPIGEYGLLADCNSAALVSRDGSIDWLCLPRYDSDAIFARMLDPDGGHWSIRPAGEFRVERRYVPGTLVIETTFTTADGGVRVRDAMAFAPGQRGHDLGYDAPHEVLRSVEGVSGSVELVMELVPRPEYGLVRPLIRVVDGGAKTVGGERNWDYRFSWIRDSSLTLEALYIGACTDEAEEFVSFMTSAAGGGASLQIMYGIGGEHDLSERVLGHLRGWRDSSPVRVGNGAWDQVQLDVYGELLNMIFVYRERLGVLHPEIQAFVAELADTAARRWREKDSGIWEMRGEPRHHLSSKVMCWVALDRAVKLAPSLGAHGVKAAAWAVERDAVSAAIVERGWSEARQAYAQSFESDELDGAALLMAIYGFLPATDPRMRSTIDAIARDLTEDGLVLRYRNDEGLNADGLTGEEGTFVICSFWLVACLARAGEGERAQRLFDQLAGYANDLGLLAEEIDTANGEQLGNFPQAFSHIGLITAASEIDKARGRTRAAG